ncbi:hypothetical protein [Rhizobium tubonense]|uniref:Uncharacterized protein n=1 Tax=Rhizobium tubonense TaxID=484088 RepID=A0A2W4D0B3_9HYPH|nr:hypothetical protein [Rhizobium tubonense]PZM15715.1 hypothetical protein CPY51_05975 [Rhizobium tubonense]
MATEVLQTLVRLAIAVIVAGLSACGTVKEKTAPCKRPAELSSYAEDPRQSCGPMHAVNDPAAAFAAIGMN